MDLRNSAPQSDFRLGLAHWFTFLVRSTFENLSRFLHVYDVRLKLATPDLHQATY